MLNIRRDKKIYLSFQLRTILFFGAQMICATVFPIVSSVSTSNYNYPTEYTPFRQHRQFVDDDQIRNDCSFGCICDDELNELRCENLELSRLPSLTQRMSNLEKISLYNCSMDVIEKNAFRQFPNLREIRLEQMPNLDLIDKHAFKGLQKLRQIEIIGNPKLRELYRASFSGIGNTHSMVILIKNNSLKRINGLTFKNANNLRELVVEDVCFQIGSQAFASIQKVDFLTIRGACFIDENAFQNTSRVHNLNIINSTLDIKYKTFAQLHHVNQVLFDTFEWTNKILIKIQLRENRIGKIEEDAFAGIFTVGSAHLHSNRIGEIQPNAFANAENLGSLVLSYNTIQNPLESPQCLVNDAQKFVFTENTLHCSCEMRWIQFHKNPALLAENYCGREEAFKALAYYKPIGCKQFISVTTTTPQLLETTRLMLNKTHSLEQDPSQETLNEDIVEPHYSNSAVKPLRHKNHGINHNKNYHSSEHQEKTFRPFSNAANTFFCSASSLLEHSQLINGLLTWRLLALYTVVLLFVHM